MRFELFVSLENKTLTGIYSNRFIKQYLLDFKRMELRKIVPNLLVLFAAFGHFSKSSELKGGLLFKSYSILKCNTNTTLCEFFPH